MKNTTKKITKIQQHIKESSVSCTSMIVSMFGDVVSQHGNWISLASLIQNLNHFGFNERQVRTSVYRLVQSDWLQVKKIGRCSYYCLTESATGHYEKAARRIYASTQVEWDQSWVLVLLVSVPEEKKEELRKSLLWQGFNTLTGGLYAHPSSELSSLNETIYELDIASDVVIFNAKTTDLSSFSAIKNLIKDKWELQSLESYYTDFLNFYRGLCQKTHIDLENKLECFLLRVMLIHDFRRILLRDPDFPTAMLPQGWVGHDAHALVKKTYKLLTEPSLDYIYENMTNAQGEMPEANNKFFKRFEVSPTE